MRYSFTKKAKNDSGKKIITTTLLNRIKKRSDDVYIVMIERTRLDHLAYKFYENPNYWWVIASANSIGGTMYVEPGTQLRIPVNIRDVIADHLKVNAS
jgi:nucleoid-associated protein YgaU